MDFLRNLPSQNYRVGSVGNRLNLFERTCSMMGAVAELSPEVGRQMIFIATNIARQLVPAFTYAATSVSGTFRCL